MRVIRGCLRWGEAVFWFFFFFFNRFTWRRVQFLSKRNTQQGSVQGLVYRNASPASESAGLFTFQHGLLARCDLCAPSETNTLSLTYTHTRSVTVYHSLCCAWTGWPCSSTRTGPHIYQTTRRTTTGSICVDWNWRCFSSLGLFVAFHFLYLFGQWRFITTQRCVISFLQELLR